jgi:hypothetical protein
MFFARLLKTDEQELDLLGQLVRHHKTGELK